MSVTGKAPPSNLSRNPARLPRSPWAPEMIGRRLQSCGYRVVGPITKHRGGDWHVATVVDRVSGEARGKRWVRWTEGTGYEHLTDAPKERP